MSFLLQSKCDKFVKYADSIGWRVAISWAEDEFDSTLIYFVNNEYRWLKDCIMNDEIMKAFFYSLYALFFNISAKLFPIKENRVCFLSMHNEGFCDSLGSVCEKLREKRPDMEAVFITREDLSLGNPVRLISFFLVKSTDSSFFISSSISLSSIKSFPVIEAE